MLPGLQRKQTDWAMGTVARLLRPIVRLALGMGLKHSQLDALLRQSLLSEARSVLTARGGTPTNVSQLAMVTGLHRKDVTSRLREGDDGGIPHTEASPASRVFTRWLQQVMADPALWRLPIADKAAGMSFETLARMETRGDVHARALLEDMERLGVVRCDGRFVELTRDGFVPSNDLQTLLSFLADNGRDHLSAGVANVTGEAPRFLERAIFTEGLSEAECEALQAGIRKDWDQLHAKIYSDMLASEQRSTDAPTHRMRVGIFTYFEPSQGGAQPPEAGSTGAPS
jgi:hypothetical protein